MFHVCSQLSLALSNGVQVGLPVSAALAAVALIGYLFGHRTRSTMVAGSDDRRQQELARAARIAWQLEHIATTLRQDLVAHHSQVAAFKRQLRQAHDRGSDTAWAKLCREAEAMLGPTMQLAHQLSHAYDRIRQQSDALETFTQGRTDPLTGVGNARALEQQLRVLLSAAARGECQFSIALLSLDRDDTAGSVQTLQSVLPLIAKLASVIRACMRDTDFVARYGDEEFVVVMPQTSLAGASVFGDRLQQRTSDELSVSLCCGITEAISGDDSRSILARADSALYSAKAAGSNRLFVHTGSHIRQHLAGVAAVSGGFGDGSPVASSNSSTILPDDGDAFATAEGVEPVGTREELGGLVPIAIETP